MAKKIDMLQSGLPSKMYYLGFKEPMSIYQMSKGIYGKVQPQKLYAWRDQLKSNSYIMEKDGKWKSSVDPLINAIETKKKIKLDEQQREILSHFLDNMFRYHISQLDIDFNNDFNALEILLFHFDLILIQYSKNLKDHPEIPYPKSTRDAIKCNRGISDIPPLKKRIVETSVKIGIPLNVAKSMPVCFLTVELIDLLKGFSSVGILFERFSESLRLENKLLQELNKRIRQPRKGFRR